MSNLLRVKVNGRVSYLQTGKILTCLGDSINVRVPFHCKSTFAPSSSAAAAAGAGDVARCLACVCAVDGDMVPSCLVDVREGMEIVTDSPELQRLRHKTDPEAKNRDSLRSSSNIKICSITETQRQRLTRAASTATAASPATGPAPPPSIFNNIDLLPEDRQFHARHGQCPVSHKISDDRILAELKTAGLRDGCSGAGDDAQDVYAKWMKAASNHQQQQKVRPSVVVADATLRALPASAILSHPGARMRMIIGACIAARVVGATAINLSLLEQHSHLRPDIEAAFRMYVTKLHPSSSALHFQVNIATAEKENKEEGEAAGAVTHGVDTLAWLPSILYCGGRHFADLSTAAGGAKLVSVRGDVTQPAVGEFSLNATLSEAVAILAPDVAREDIAALELRDMRDQCAFVMGRENISRALDSTLDALPLQQTTGDVAIHRRNAMSA